MKEYTTIIFDLDGTLADTSEGIYNCVRYTQNKMNLPEITDAQLHSHIGPPMHESYAKNFGLSGEELERAVGYHKEYALQQGWRETAVYRGIPELLYALQKKGIRLAVATLKYEDTAKKMLKHLEIDNFFTTICGTLTDIKMTKSELLKKCIQNCNGDITKTILIGDSSYDAIGAHQAGIDFFGVTYGFGFKSKADVDEYPNVGCVEKVENVSKILI